MRLQELYDRAKVADRKDICRFMRDMKRAGLRIRYYEGRYFWKGPAVSCDHPSDVMTSTKVRCQWDSMGRGSIVYPMQSL